MLVVALTALAWGQEPALDLQRFQPVGPSHGFIVTPTGRTPEAGSFSFGVIGEASGGGFLRARLEDGVIVESRAVRQISAGHLHGDFGLADGVAMTLQVPALQGVTEVVPRLTFGDVRFGMTFRPVAERILGIALDTNVRFPTGGAQVTRRVVTPGARLSLSKTLGPIHLAAVGGVRLLPIPGYLPDEVGITHEALVGGGIGWEGLEGFRVNLETTGAIIGPNGRLARSEGYRDALHTPLEGVASVRLAPHAALDLVAGGATALVKGVATPTWRAFGGITVRGRLAIQEEPSVVPLPEVPSLPVVESVPVRPTVPVGSTMPVRPTVPVGPSVPTQPEVVGLPDRDGDGIDDAQDRCPDEAEDTDGFLDHDGCPEPDNDADGILDVDDLCPVDPEQYNGEKDEDGCPDELQIVLSATRLHILEQVTFAPGSAVLDAASTPLLTAIVDTLTEHPEILLVRVEGHTDDTGNADANLRLSGRRAATVRDWLIERGIAPERLESEGFGSFSPLVPNDSAAAREKNRRVEFHVIGRTSEADEAPPIGKPSDEAAPAVVPNPTPAPRAPAVPVERTVPAVPAERTAPTEPSPSTESEPPLGGESG